MQSIFNRSPYPTSGISIPAGWNNARSGLTRNLIQIVEYFHNRSMAIKTNHLLVKLLNSARLNYEDHIELFYSKIGAITNQLAQSFKITSPVNSGAKFDGVFYGAGTTEILALSTESFDVHSAAEHWKTLSPIRVLMHDKTDLEMHIPNGIAYSNELGVAVISINIPMLFVMYRGFVQEQLVQLRKGKQAKSTSQFVHTYVLPNMIGSHLDVALFNRTIALICGAKVANGTSRKHPISVANWTSQTDRVIKELAKPFTNQRYSLHNLLCMVPAVFTLNGAQAMQLPSMPPVQQYLWVEYLARMKVVGALGVLSPDRLAMENRGDIQSINRTIDYENVLQRPISILGKDANDLQELAELMVTLGK